jgi:uncharacterized protein (TIGR02284 family)
MSYSVTAIQDLMDIIHISHDRANVYNKTAYECKNLPLKMLLNEEADQARDCAWGVKKLLHRRFSILSENPAAGPVYDVWASLRPSFSSNDEETLLSEFEMADLHTLQCYYMAIARPSVDPVTKNLLEFQYRNTLVAYNSMKAFRHSYGDKMKEMVAVLCRA